MKKPASSTMSFRLDAELRQALKAKALQLQKSESWIIKQCLKALLKSDNLQVGRPQKGI